MATIQLFVEYDGVVKPLLFSEESPPSFDELLEHAATCFPGCEPVTAFRVACSGVLPSFMLVGEYDMKHCIFRNGMVLELLKEGEDPSFLALRNMVGHVLHDFESGDADLSTNASELNASIDEINVAAQDLSLRDPRSSRTPVLLLPSACAEVMCTFKTTHKRHVTQLWRPCETCWPQADNTGACLACCSTCHAGHLLGEERLTAFYCDCAHRGQEDSSDTTSSDSDDVLSSTIKVLTWNIWLKFGQWERRQVAILEDIRALDPDIVALQEVYEHNGIKQSEILAAHLDMHEAYVGLEMVSGVRCGNAVLSKFPIIDTAYRELPAVQELHEHCVCLFVLLDAPRGAIPVFVTHLNWRFDHSRVRQAQVRACMEFIKETLTRVKVPYPPIFCGDFNAEPESDEIRLITGLSSPPVDGLVFHDAWKFAGQDKLGYTWDNVNPNANKALEPNRRIDFVFVADDILANSGGYVVHADLCGTRPRNGVWPSDHSGVVAELRY